jgi:hypothetical protein
MTFNGVKYREYVYETIIEVGEGEETYNIYIKGMGFLYVANSPESYPIRQEGGGK